MRNTHLNSQKAPVDWPDKAAQLLLFTELAQVQSLGLGSSQPGGPSGPGAAAWDGSGRAARSRGGRRR